MALSVELEKLIWGLRGGVTAAPVAEVANERSQLQQVLDAIKAEKFSLTSEQSAAIAEVQANIDAGASVVSNKRATLLTMFTCFDSPKTAKPAESTKG
jgi:hypothetical protein